MTTRRRFIQGLTAFAPIFPLGQAFAASPDPSRLALVIGNSTYRDAPLVNPVNDARAVAGLLGQAGFTVSSQLNVQRVAMMAAIEKFAVDVRKSETKLVMFYYAGHGAQLDWRNYLLPVDAVADSSSQLRQSCIDLNELIGQLGKSKDKTFVIMLDACRNNPFGSSYQPEQKGLSQFDAPVGSLLAYATSPGNVASDGAGQNGLYTENLVRELSVRGTRIEDALKRVRLNVRLASRGAQIPWETTSLEDDVFIFNDGKKKLSEEEQEQLLEADLNEWARIKTSGNVEDWVGYLRNFPNGRFAEIAQTRLTRLLTPVAKPEPVSVAVAAPAEPAPAPQAVATAVTTPDGKQALDVACAAPAGEIKRNLAVRNNCVVTAQAPTPAPMAVGAATPVAAAVAEVVAAATSALAVVTETVTAAASVSAPVPVSAPVAAATPAMAPTPEPVMAAAPAPVAAPAAVSDPAPAPAAAAAPVNAPLPEPVTAAAPAPAPVAAEPFAQSAAATPAIDLAPNRPVSQFLKVSANPFSAGRYPLGRKFSIGDAATYRNSDLITDVERDSFSLRVTGVDLDNDRIELNNGKFIIDSMGNYLRTPVGGESDVPQQFNPAELQIGKTWSAGWKQDNVRWGKDVVSLDLRIAAFEKVRVPAGEFMAFRIDILGWHLRNPGTFKREERFWLVPGINFAIKGERTMRHPRGALIRTDRLELVSLRQQAIDVSLQPATRVAG